MDIFGLLYVADNSEKHANLRSTNAFDVYLRCAALCKTSANSFDCNYTLVTNELKYVQLRLRALGIDITTRACHFRREVPEGIPFRSAHHKLELLDLFASGECGEFPILLDLDAVITKPIKNMPRELIAYDISSQVVPVYGVNKIQQDLTKLSGRPIPARWYGGEFIGGRPHQFKELSAVVWSNWDRYLSLLDELHHVGDEMLLSAALSSFSPADASPYIARWWSARTLSPLPRFGEIQDRPILHLPADKGFLAEYPTEDFSGERFIADYRSYARRKALIRTLRGWLSPDGKHPPRI